MTIKAQHIPHLKKITRGIEREVLRVDDKGKLALSKHPESLGAALTHEFITTDFSEALLEFVTPTFNSIDECLEFLTQLHKYSYQHVADNEFLWMNSMPCILPGVTPIPIAQFGHSHSGMMKHIYRQGLSNRYGSAMQTIAGIHYNFSYPQGLLDELAAQRNQNVSELYLGMIRNFHRLSWVLLYFFGATPALCKTFLQNHQQHDLEEFDPHTLYGEHATSLRMSDLGYQNNAQSLINVSLNSLDEYTDTLIRATNTPYPPYADIGIKDKDDGSYKQLNTHILQIENEYYASIRPKQPIQSGEKPTHALKQRGIKYVEVRNIDIDPFCAVGINKQQIKFIDLLLSHCLYSPSEHLFAEEQTVIANNNQRVSRQGRKPQLMMCTAQHSVTIEEWLHTLFDELAPYADAFDKAHEKSLYSDVLNDLKKSIDHKERLPSAKVLAQMKENKETFFAFAKRHALVHQQTLAQHPSDNELFKRLDQQAITSLQLQKAREDEDKDSSFEDYLTEYYQS